MSANDFIRYFRSETIPVVDRTVRRKNGMFRVILISGVTSLILGGTLPGVNTAVEVVASEPPRRAVSLLSSPYDVSRLDGDAEKKLVADLTTAEDAYADHSDPAQFDRDCAAAFRRYGLDLDQVDAEVAGERLGRRASTRDIAVQIDRWARVRRRQLAALNWRRLVEVARVADPDPWRDALRSQVDRSPAERLAALRKLAADTPAVEKQNAASLITLSQMIEEAGDPSSAKSLLHAAANRFASNFWIWFELGNLSDSSATSPDPGEAARCFGKAVALRPRSLATHTSLGKALANQGKMDEATAEFLEADRLKKDSNVTLTDVKQFDQILAKVETGAAHDRAQAVDQPDSDQPVMTHEALTEILSPTPKSVPAAPQSAAGFYNRGIESAQHKEYGRAISDFDKVIKLDPTFASAYVVRGEIRLMKRDFDRAIADYDLALRLDRQSGAYRGRGFAWLGKKKLAQAIDDFNEAIRIEPEDPRSYYGRGYAWSAKKEYEKARIDFDDAIRLDALFSSAYVGRGHAWNSQKEYDKAIADFDDAVRLEPKGASAFTGRGYAWSQKNNYEKALVDYEMAIQLDPEDAGALNGRAWLWSTSPDAKFRDGNRACESARKACELTEWKDAMVIDTLAAASAETGDFDSAVKWQTRALEILTDEKDRDEFRARLVLYQQKKPYRQPAGD
jgi:tetratricopeptide (TPR) repeat protein